MSYEQLQKLNDKIWQFLREPEIREYFRGNPPTVHQFKAIMDKITVEGNSPDSRLLFTIEDGKEIPIVDAVEIASTRISIRVIEGLPDNHIFMISFKDSKVADLGGNQNG